MRLFLMVGCFWIGLVEKGHKKRKERLIFFFFFFFFFLSSVNFVFGRYCLSLTLVLMMHLRMFKLLTVL